MTADSPEAFVSALAQAYCAAPAEVLPNALWKTLARLPGCETVFRRTPAGLPDHLEIWQTNRLLLYWDRERAWRGIPEKKLQSLTFALLHDHYIAHLDACGFTRRRGYFRLVQRGPAAPPRLPTGLIFQPVQIESQAGLAADLIARCYPDLRPGEDTVRGWARHPVFDPRLWVWVWDAQRQQPAGLGIAEIDRSCGEGALEWVQVLPEYRGTGIGQALVLELLRRLSPQAKFVTVSGKVDSRTRPERLYRRCGFQGSDVWWLLEK